MRIGLIVLGSNYLIHLIWKRIRRGRDPDPRIARLETWQLGGFFGGLGAFGLAAVCMATSVSVELVLGFALAGVAGMVVYVVAYFLAWRPQ